MGRNHVNVVSIFLDALLVSCLVLSGLPGAQSDSKTQGTTESAQGPTLSTSAECARTCYEGEPPKTCYYHFSAEFYSVLGGACELCTPNDTNRLDANCQCVTADGVERSILSVNRMLPGPSIEVCQGDKVVVDVLNNMQGLALTIHWHGILQKGTQYYDGVPMITQCPISQGNTFRYQWVAENPGTHFWHSHAGLQKMDGVYGGIIIREPVSKDPNSHLYDEDSPAHVMLISDWMHEQATEHFPGLIKIHPGQEPESALINGKGQYTDPNTGSTTNTPLEVFTVKPGRRYRFRMIDAFCSVCPAQLSIEGHVMTLIATDGNPVQPVNIDTIISFTGERWDFVIHANQTPGDYWIQLRALGACGPTRVQQLGILRYEGQLEKPISEPPSYDIGLPQGVVLNPIDAICDVPRKDAVCVNQLQHATPIDKEILKPQPDVKIFLSYHFLDYTREELFEPKTYKRFSVAGNDSLSIPIINGISFQAPSSPPLSQINDIPSDTLCTEDKKPASCGKFCSCTHRIDIPMNSVVEVIIVDEMGIPNLSHPFHLHGYAYNVVGMGRSPDKNITKITLDHVRDLDSKGQLQRDWNMLPLKDVVQVPNNGYAIFRFFADNPGEWLLHCHFIYHIGIGMDVVLHVGTPEDLPPVPPGFPVCGNWEPPIATYEEDSICYA